jgi:hypothetical protein
MRTGGYSCPRGISIIRCRQEEEFHRDSAFLHLFGFGFAGSAETRRRHFEHEKSAPISLCLDRNFPKLGRSNLHLKLFFLKVSYICSDMQYPDSCHSADCRAIRMGSVTSVAAALRWHTHTPTGQRGSRPEKWSRSWPLT